MKNLAVLGSTGSVGTQTLDVVRKHPDRFRVVALVAGSNDELLSQQADEFGPELVVLAARDGDAAIVDAATLSSADVVVNAIVGSRGLLPTLAALDAGKAIALANKESLIAGGELVMEKVAGRPERLIPIDSEHSALWQALNGQRDVRRLIVTASGGPFRGMTRDALRGITVDQALAHPTWKMGPKITIDSSTLMNKGLEAIEAHHLFSMPMDRIEIVVQPQSIIHGIVEFIDGSCIAQAAHNDMRLPIQVALSWPERLPDGAEPLDWSALGSLQFEPVDHETFPAIGLAYDAARRGSTYPCVLNAANEEAVAAFLAGRIAWLDITGIVEHTLARHDAPGAVSLEAVLDAERWARAASSRAIEEAAR
jgi:1-deoxy-D-xylulose-5-phosphate reductoisomerase